MSKTLLQIPELAGQIIRQILFPKPALALALKARIGIVFLTLASSGLQAQAVSEIVTDFNGYWKSSNTAINSVKPDNSHNLVSFTYNGIRVSTGVNDALLTSKGLSYIPGDFRALPMLNITGTPSGNTKIGMGALADGILNGGLLTAPSRNFGTYLTDGVNGLDIGTCVANLPAGTMFLSVTNLRSQNIGDGGADILVTQVADPSSQNDRYEFTDVYGVRVGNSKDIILSGISPVGNWVADFYEATGSNVLLSGFTQTQRPMRLWAADFSDFGIDSTNINRIAYFKITLSGQSDLAFVAYNNNTLNVQSILPVNFTSFTGRTNADKVDLKWTTANGVTNRFEIESSVDGTNFESLATVAAKNHSGGSFEYNYTVKNAPVGTRYFRIKQIDINGSYDYSRIIQVVAIESKATLSAFPNPAKSFITVNHPAATANESITLYHINGSVAMRKVATAGAVQTKIDVQSLNRGSYYLSFGTGNIRTSQLVVVQ